MLDVICHQRNVRANDSEMLVTRMAKTKITDNIPGADKDIEPLEFSYIAGKDRK